VAKCERRVILGFIGGGILVVGRHEDGREMPNFNTMYAPSTDWSQGGPIIEREGIELVPDGGGAWGAAIRGGDEDDTSQAYTPLIAAMRAYVASKLGDEVEVPEGLK
jgi:hypothetical protein